MAKSKYVTADGVEVTATLVQGREETTPEGLKVHHDFWEITFPDGTVKEMIDTNQLTGEPVFAAHFTEV